MTVEFNTYLTFTFRRKLHCCPSCVLSAVQYTGVLLQQIIQKRRRKFRGSFPGILILSKPTIYWPVKKFRTRSWLKKRRVQTRRVLSEETLDGIGVRSQARPRTSVRQLPKKPDYQSHVHKQPQYSFIWCHTNLQVCKNSWMPTALQGYGFVTGSVMQFLVVKSSTTTYS